MNEQEMREYLENLNQQIYKIAAGFPEEEEKSILTDACKMYVLKGEHVHVLKGEVFNIKITYPFDMRVAQSLIGCADELEEKQDD